MERENLIWNNGIVEQTTVSPPLTLLTSLLLPSRVICESKNQAETTTTIFVYVWSYVWLRACLSVCIYACVGTRKELKTENATENLYYFFCTLSKHRNGQAGTTNIYSYVYISLDLNNSLSIISFWWATTQTLQLELVATLTPSSASAFNWIFALPLSQGKKQILSVLCTHFDYTLLIKHLKPL